MSSLKKLAVSLAVIAVLLAGCSSSKYTDKIDKAVKMQDKTRKIAKTIRAMKSNILIKDANIYVLIKEICHSSL